MYRQHKPQLDHSIHLQTVRNCAVCHTITCAGKVAIGVQRYIQPPLPSPNPRPFEHPLLVHLSSGFFSHFVSVTTILNCQVTVFFLATRSEIARCELPIMIFPSTIVIVTQIYSLSSNASVSSTEADGFMWVAQIDILSIIVTQTLSQSDVSLSCTEANGSMWVALDDISVCRRHLDLQLTLDILHRVKWIHVSCS